MPARANEPASPIPSARLDDLDLDREEDEEECERRLMALASARIVAERIRLERLGIIDANGDLVSRELPPDMLPDSDTTLEIGGSMSRPRMIVVAGPPGSGKTRYFPVTALDIDAFNIDDRCAASFDQSAGPYLRLAPQKARISRTSNSSEYQ